ncbi:hypothetical protein PRIPAC_90557 [Pristionchus pacificus]|uniref:Uncharacterized protein n=1 Tax=Pristionchus pacificus TaxID=54126 RepID=A0A2A6B3S3_PRIPA|nr:hypothetical protein PRIPAC_90557 [Pristionchus pacificus]|eukprot:PDM60524.1 hypothetical protein PRIPAC_53502 [Pristionchus pacificus]
MPSIQSSLPFVNSPLSSGVHPSMSHLPTGQSHLDLLVSALKPHFVAPSPISHTIPRVKNGETQEIIASLVEAANEAEKVKVGRGSIDTVISLILERIQVLVVQETSPGFSDSFKKVKALQSLAGGGMDPQLLAAAMTMTASTSNSLPSTSKEESWPDSARFSTSLSRKGAGLKEQLLLPQSLLRSCLQHKIHLLQLPSTRTQEPRLPSSP